MKYLIINSQTGQGLKSIIGKNWRLPVWADRLEAYKFNDFTQAHKFAKTLGADHDKIKVEKV